MDFGISFPVQAPNFHSLFFGKKILDLNPQDWINGTRDPGFAINNFQEGCFEIGFNVGDENEIQARIGVVSKNNTGQWAFISAVNEMKKIPRGTSMVGA
jgi:hypothetical protein